MTQTNTTESGSWQLFWMLLERWSEPLYTLLHAIASVLTRLTRG